MKRLYKSEKDKKVSGVLAGIAEYYGVDPSIARVGFVFLTVITAVIPCIIAYFVVAMIMPTKSEVEKNG
jgi:phage shock protein C